MPSCVIVGASRGIGYQYLKTLSEDPSNTIIGLVRDLAATQAQVTADNLKNVHLLTADITAAPALNAAAEKTAKLTNGVVDYLIVNAGYISHDTGFMTPTDYIGKEDFFLKEFDTCMHTNVAGAMFAINAFLPLVKASKIKKVVSISSGHADENCVLAAGAGLATAIPYALSKVALNMLNVKYAVKYKDEGIIFLSLAPGVVLTAAPTLEAAPEEVKQAYGMYKEPFRKINPNWDGPILPKESVDLMLKVIHKVTIEDTGAFLSQHGDKNWL